jgi:imidazole glycerol-phosphate synthase subunit HisH
LRTVVIVDYGMCNLDSISRAVEECGGSPRVTDRPEVLEEASYLVLPGVGSFAQAMKNLRDRGLDSAIVEQVRGKQIPLLGICLGMQLLGTKGTEGGATDGLGLIDGEIRKLEATSGDFRIPHVGWNEVVQEKECPLFRGIPSGKDFYFVHSYHFVARDQNSVVARTPYCGGFASVVSRDAIWGVQFHPEKSQNAGFQVLRNFLAV